MISVNVKLPPKGMVVRAHPSAPVLSAFISLHIEGAQALYFFT